jgi:hypothetical protein
MNPETRSTVLKPGGRAIISHFRVVDTAREHHRALPVAKRGLNAALYRGVFQPLYSLLPEKLALRWAYKFSVPAAKS